MISQPQPLNHLSGHAADPEMLTIAEVATLLRVPVATLRYWRHRGDGPRSFRMGRSVRYFRTDVLAWLTAVSADRPRH